LSRCALGVVWSLTHRFRLIASAAALFLALPLLFGFFLLSTDVPESNPVQVLSDSQRGGLAEEEFVNCLAKSFR
jgi:hypothetical protein